MRLDETVTWKSAPEDYERALGEELRFIADWQNGQVPFLSAITRIRQIYRAFPWILNKHVHDSAAAMPTR